MVRVQHLEYKNGQQYVERGCCTPGRSTAHGIQDCKALHTVLQIAAECMAVGGERLLYVIYGIQEHTEVAEDMIL